MTLSYWLVTQSVTSYINLQGALLGVCCCLVVQVNLSLCKQYYSICQQPIPKEDNPGSMSAPRPSIPCTTLEPAQPLLPR